MIFSSFNICLHFRRE